MRLGSWLRRMHFCSMISAALTRSGVCRCHEGRHPAVLVLLWLFGFTLLTLLGVSSFVWILIRALWRKNRLIWAIVRGDCCRVIYRGILIRHAHAADSLDLVYLSQTTYLTDKQNCRPSPPSHIWVSCIFRSLARLMITAKSTVERVLDGFIEERACFVKELGPVVLIADVVLTRHLRDEKRVLLCEVCKVLLGGFLVVVGGLSAHEEGGGVYFVRPRHSVSL